MRAWWGKIPWLGVLLVLMAGCRTAPPEIKPKKVPEVCSDPPAGDRRYDTPYLPPEAFKDVKDPMQKAAITPNMGAGGMGAGGMSSPGRPGGF